MPPEYFDGSHYGVELDNWQLGLMFYCMLTGMTLNWYAQDFARPITALTNLERDELKSKNVWFIWDDDDQGDMTVTKKSSTGSNWNRKSKKSSSIISNNSMSESEK